MTIRFRRRLRIMPGLSLNLGRRGVSASVGGRGAHVTFGRRGSRVTVGLPGTGLSATTYRPYHKRLARAAAEQPGLIARLAGYLVAGLFFAWLFGMF